MDSILTSIKTLFGIPEEDTSFDEELIMHINSVFSVLAQLGVGDLNAFHIDDSSAIWTDFAKDMSKIEMVKSYIFQKVKLLFDPPMSSAVMDATNRIISELENRLFMEFNYTSKEESDGTE